MSTATLSISQSDHTTESPSKKITDLPLLSEESFTQVEEEVEEESLSNISSSPPPKTESSTVSISRTKTEPITTLEHHTPKQKRVKIGKAVEKTDKNYYIVVGMLLGIRLTCGRNIHDDCQKLTFNDFVETRKFKIPRMGSSNTPAHAGEYDFKFKDYSPNIFYRLRQSFGIDQADYLVSLTADYLLSEVITQGKSGSMFYFSHDGRFVIKTINRNEHKFIRTLLPNYFSHIMRFPNSLLTKFFGLHRFKTYKGRKIHFVVMGNVFTPDHEPHEQFDLKGSTFGRYLSEKERNKLPENLNPTYKDLDFLRKKMHLHVGPAQSKALLTQIRQDADFLAAENIMDYSLLLGIHYRSRAKQEHQVVEEPGMRKRALSIFTSPDVPRILSESDYTIEEYTENPKRTNSHLESDDDEADDSHYLPSGRRLSEEIEVQSRDYIPSLFESESTGGFEATNPDDSPRDELYYIGIIDILQKYNRKKAAEHRFKSLRYPSQKRGISACSPVKYADRFYAFIAQYTHDGTKNKYDSQSIRLHAKKALREQKAARRASVLSLNEASAAYSAPPPSGSTSSSTIPGTPKGILPHGSDSMGPLTSKRSAPSSLSLEKEKPSKSSESFVTLTKT